MAKKLKDGRQQRNLDLLTACQRVFETEDGKQLLFDMMKSNGMFTTTFNENPYTSAFLEGRRSMVADLIANLDKDVSSIYKMIKEQQELEKMY